MVVEVVADNGVTGFGITTGGYPAAWLVMNHLDRFVVGKDANEIEKIWDQMYRASLYYGRKGVVMNAISAIDLALWDLLGKLREEPVYAMLGGKVREELTFYATGPRPDLAKKMGFVGGKIPLVYGPADGMEGLKKSIELAADMREKCGDEFLPNFSKLVIWLKLMENMSFLMEAVHTAIITLQPRQTHRSQSA